MLTFNGILRCDELSMVFSGSRVLLVLLNQFSHKYFSPRATFVFVVHPVCVFYVVMRSTVLKNRNLLIRIEMRTIYTKLLL